MFPFTPHTTLRLSFGLGGSLFSGDFPDRLPVFFTVSDFWGRIRADCPVRISGELWKQFVSFGAVFFCYARILSKCT